MQQRPPDVSYNAPPDPVHGYGHAARGRRFSQRDNLVPQLFPDRSAWATIDNASAAISAVGTAAWPYAMLIRPQTVTALLAGPTPPWPPAPWQSADRGWLIDRNRLAAVGDDGSPRPSDTFVALGSYHGSVLLVDLACAPDVISINGDQDAAPDLMQSLVNQLQMVPRNRVHAAAERLREVLTAPPDRRLDRLSQETGAADDDAGSWTFLLSAGLTPEEVIQLRALAADAGRTRVLVLGSVAGSRWSLLADANGKVTADGLGLTTLSGPALLRAPERTTPQVPFPAPWRGLPAPVPSAPYPPRSDPSRRTRPGPRHAKPRTPSPAPPDEQPRPWPHRPDSEDNDGETWLSRTIPANPFARHQEDPSEAFTK